MPFYFFFGAFGLIIGALIAWFFLAEHPFESPETPGGPVDEAEATLLAGQMTDEGMPMDETAVARMLELHGAYLDGRYREALAAREAAAKAEAAKAAQAVKAAGPADTTPESQG
jgi:hypothetical protein